MTRATGTLCDRIGPAISFGDAAVRIHTPVITDCDMLPEGYDGSWTRDESAGRAPSRAELSTHTMNDRAGVSRVLKKSAQSVARAFIYERNCVRQVVRGARLDRWGLSSFIYACSAAHIDIRGSANQP